MRSQKFIFRVSLAEHQLIKELAKRLQRTQSDAVRYVVVEASRQLSHNDSSAPTQASKELPLEDVDRENQ
jgi:hypothetical protein